MARRRQQPIRSSIVTDRGGERPLKEGLHGNVSLNGATRRIVAACVAFLSCTALVYAQQTTTGSAATAPQSQTARQNPNPANAASAASAIPSYPDSPAGLEKLIKDMMKIQKDGDTKNLASYVQSLILPNPNAWFRATFGEQTGAELADSYDRVQMNLPLSFPDTLSQLQKEHMTKLDAIVFTDSCNPEATDTEYPVLQSRTHEQPLYVVRASSGTEIGTLQYFAYSDGAFRYLSNFQMKVPVSHAIRVGGNVMAKKLIRSVIPVYPNEAKYNHIQGTVLLHAIIGTDGRVCHLQVVSGPPLLVQAAMKSVSEWQYSPTTLNGQPVQMDTVIKVVFDLGSGP